MKVLSKFRVDIDSFCTSSHRSPEEYGDWEESYDNSLRTISLGEFEYPDVVSSLDFSKVPEVYVVWLEYSNGDSFGVANCCGTEVIGVFEDGNSALELKKALEDNKPSYQNDWETRYTLDVTTSDGQVFNLNTTHWNDYFGGLDSVHVEKKILCKV